MIRSSIISSLVLSLVLVAGCDKSPEGTTPPDGDQTADADGKKPKKGKDKDGGDEGKTGDDGAVAAADENDPTKKVCPAETAEFPEVYFEETVLIRLPKGVTADNFVEMQPGFASLAADVESVSCIADMPGAMITHMALAAFGEEPGKDMITWRDETLKAFGYEGGKLSEEKLAPEKRYYQVVVDMPPGNGSPEPARALFQMVAANGQMYALVMETHPDAWNAMKETFYRTAEKLSFLKPQ